ncbi:hypothetical protein BDV26DRAFT_243443 [Aspergillus bertholletiae]|uniref:Uncharacterized protein n=1 Tax=Aspergillus bertholletiae TaxID=1226010 RepID=A0A5N7B2A6_9EURO|nr:hypothetical protein BDV26DRAFT_243443 [Aspergillus bertholletiae]
MTWSTRPFGYLFRLILSGNIFPYWIIDGESKFRRISPDNSIDCFRRFTGQNPGTLCKPDKPDRFLPFLIGPTFLPCLPSFPLEALPTVIRHTSYFPSISYPTGYQALA